MGPNALYRNDQPAPADGYLTDALEREAVAFVDRNANNPFFLYLAFNAVHTPMHARPQDEAKFSSIKDQTRRKYAAMLSRMDEAIGKVHERLVAHGIVNDTLVFFISDNGGPPVNGSSNGVLNGHKATTWEGGVRVPFLVSWPGKLPEGKKYDKPVIQLDIAPTALAAANVNFSDAGFDGVNLLPYLTGINTGSPHDALYWRFGAQWAIRLGDWKLAKSGQFRVDRGAPVADANAAETFDGAKLFNLASDIGEKNDLAAQQPEKVAALKEKWSEWTKGLVQPAWGQPRAAAKKKKGKQDA
jgi:arylsulfatase A-like enzyme